MLDGPLLLSREGLETVEKLGSSQIHGHAFIAAPQAQAQSSVLLAAMTSLPHRCCPQTEGCQAGIPSLDSVRHCKWRAQSNGPRFFRSVPAFSRGEAPAALPNWQKATEGRLGRQAEAAHRRQ
jgi:hypothetical protein